MNFECLTDIADIIMGQSPPSSSYHKEKQGLPFFQGKIDFGELYPSVRIYCDEPTRIAEDGDILLSVRAPVGPINVANVCSCIGRGLAAIRPGRNLNLWYLFYFLRLIEPKLVEKGRGSTFEAISRSVIESIRIPLPSLPEQQRIAAILQKADRLRRLRRYARSLSDTYLQSVFLEMFGDPFNNPKRWEFIKLGKLCLAVIDCPHETPSFSPNKTEFPCVRSSDIQNGYFDWSTTKFVNYETYKRRILRGKPIAGDIIYCREGARFGNAAIVPQNMKICLGQRTMLFRPSPKLATSAFIWLFLENTKTKQLVANLAGGSASPHINVQSLKNLEVITPPLSLQQQLSRVVSCKVNSRKKMIESERQVEHLFQSLLQHAFNGEL